MPDLECPVHRAVTTPEKPCPKCGGPTAWVAGEASDDREHRRGVTCTRCGWKSARADGAKPSRLETAVQTWPDIAAGVGMAWGDRPLRGTSHLVALALHVLDLPVVFKTTLRALIPEEGRTTGKNNKTSLKVQRALRVMEAVGWVRLIRNPDPNLPGLIEVVDRDSLLGWVTGAQDPHPDITYRLLEVGRSAQRLVAEMERDGLDDQHRRELAALSRLMARPPAPSYFRRPVRVVPSSSPL
jgi:hypothetical protein